MTGVASPRARRVQAPGALARSRRVLPRPREINLNQNIDTLFIYVMKFDPFSQRIRPDRGVAIKEHLPTLVFVTICTKGRKPWLATDQNHQLLRTIWTEATYWKIGPYVILPNHLHFFAWPGRLHADIDDWMQYWKSIFTKRLGRPE